MPNKITKKEQYFIVLFVAVFVIATLIQSVSFFSSSQKTTIIFSLFAILFLATLSIFSGVLKEQWQEFKKKLWLRLLLSLILAIGIGMVLQLTRSLLPSNWLMTNGSDIPDMGFTITVLVVSSIQPLLAPFYEEMLFRYLFMSKVPNRSIKLVMLFAQAIIFGLMHTFNFGGNPLATIPYMIVALYFGIVYLLFNNIWINIVTHFIFNFSGAILPIIFVLPSLLFNK